jgi:prepilin-type N-terminal cleavage/methylation domain-containing protein
MRERSAGRGFTLLELTVVLTMIGVLLAVAIPAFAKYVRKTRTSEAMMNVATIVALERSYYIDHRAYVPCPATPQAVPKGKDATWPGGEAWDRIGFHPESAVRYQYEVEVKVKDGAFTARARGDLDGDGIASLFELVGQATPTGQKDAASFYKENEIE